MLLLILRSTHSLFHIVPQRTCEGKIKICKLVAFYLVLPFSEPGYDALFLLAAIATFGMPKIFPDYPQQTAYIYLLPSRCVSSRSLESYLNGVEELVTILSWFTREQMAYKHKVDLDERTMVTQR